MHTIEQYISHRSQLPPITPGELYWLDQKLLLDSIVKRLEEIKAGDREIREAVIQLALEAGRFAPLEKSA